jgi:hypothetical protein
MSNIPRSRLHQFAATLDTFADGMMTISRSVRRLRRAAGSLILALLGLVLVITLLIREAMRQFA